MSADKGWKHDDLANDLAKHLRANGNRLVWEDMQIGPAGSPRPDVYTIDKSYSRFCPTAYECKISRSDFRADVTAAKWQTYLDFSSAVIFATPRGLITREDIPSGAGLIVRHDSGWRMTLKPTFNMLTTLPRDAWMKLLMDGVHYAQENRSPRFVDDWRKYEILRQKAGNEIASILSNVDSAKYRLNHQLQQLKTAENEAEAERLKIREKIKAEEIQVDGMRAELARALGLDPKSSVWKIQAECRLVAASLKVDQAYRAVHRGIENALRALEHAKLTIPKIGEDDVG